MSDIEEPVLRYSRQVVLKVMEFVRTAMRGSNRLAMKQEVENMDTEKSELNLTKAIDKQVEDLMLDALQRKFAKIQGVGAFTVFSEELGIKTFPEGASEDDAELVIFMDPVDGTEFAESLQGGWCLLAVYDRRQERVMAAVAGDIFLDRLYWASQSRPAEAIDFITHSWFKLDGGPGAKPDLEGARVNVLTTKVSRYRAVAEQDALLDALDQGKGRINLAWGSNLIIQVAAGYADAAVEFDKGFATYDILPGLFIAEKAKLSILDLEGRPLRTRLDIPAIFSRYREDSSKPERTTFVAAKHPNLAKTLVELLRPRDG